MARRGSARRTVSPLRARTGVERLGVARRSGVTTRLGRAGVPPTDRWLGERGTAVRSLGRGADALDRRASGVRCAVAGSPPFGRRTVTAVRPPLVGETGCRWTRCGVAPALRERSGALASGRRTRLASAWPALRRVGAACVAVRRSGVVTTAPLRRVGVSVLVTRRPSTSPTRRGVVCTARRSVLVTRVGVRRSTTP